MLVKSLNNIKLNYRNMGTLYTQKNNDHNMLKEDQLNPQIFWRTIKSVSCIMWKIARVTPVYKSGIPTNESNYNSISILPIMSKLLEKAIFNQLKEYLEQNTLLLKYLFGYRVCRLAEVLSNTILG